MSLGHYTRLLVWMKRVLKQCTCVSWSDNIILLRSIIKNRGVGVYVGYKLGRGGLDSRFERIGFRRKLMGKPVSVESRVWWFRVWRLESRSIRVSVIVTKAMWSSPEENRFEGLSNRCLLVPVTLNTYFHRARNIHSRHAFSRQFISVQPVLSLVRTRTNI